MIQTYMRQHEKQTTPPSDVTSRCQVFGTRVRDVSQERSQAALQRPHVTLSICSLSFFCAKPLAGENLLFVGHNVPLGLVPCPLLLKESDTIGPCLLSISCLMALLTEEA